jgi:SnoaL-like domain
VRIRGPEDEPRLQALLALMADDVQYVDVPTARARRGHEGVREMAVGASTRFREIELTAASAFADGRRYAIEYEVRILFDDGTGVAIPGVAVGELDAAGKVAIHRDYYDRSRFPR